jgi:hypothetical protein
MSRDEAGSREQAFGIGRRVARSPSQVWGWPVSLAATSLCGLFSALLGEGGVWWLLSWIGLAAPLVTASAYLCRRAAARNPS